LRRTRRRKAAKKRIEVGKTKDQIGKRDQGKDLRKKKGGWRIDPIVPRNQGGGKEPAYQGGGRFPFLAKPRMRL